MSGLFFDLRYVEGDNCPVSLAPDFLRHVRVYPVIQPARENDHAPGHRLVIHLGPAIPRSFLLREILRLIHDQHRARVDKFDIAAGLRCLDVVDAAPDAAG